MNRRNMTICFVVGITLLIIVSITLYLYFVSYNIKFNINSDSVAYAKIIYYGDGFEKNVEDKKSLITLINALNKVNLKRHQNMSHIAPKSGVLIVELYNDSNELIDYITFYEWVYRGGQVNRKETKDGEYFMPLENRDLYNIYDVCDEISGDPFNRLKN